MPRIKKVEPKKYFCVEGGRIVHATDDVAERKFVGGIGVDLYGRPDEAGGKVFFSLEESRTNLSQDPEVRVEYRGRILDQLEALVRLGFSRHKKVDVSVQLGSVFPKFADRVPTIEKNKELPTIREVLEEYRSETRK